MTIAWIPAPEKTRIAYDVEGQGPALMLLHGAGKTRRDWYKQGYVARLRDDFTVITVDLRGTGESDYLVEINDYTIEKICQDLYTVADACGVAQFAILGFSFGGNIARYPAIWSERITGIAVIGVPFGRAVDQAFEQYIIGFEPK
jgi:pimeloyl-ACP methyl ester carboxylesterase